MTVTVCSNEMLCWSDCVTARPKQVRPLWTNSAPWEGLWSLVWQILHTLHWLQWTGKPPSMLVACLMPPDVVWPDPFGLCHLSRRIESISDVGSVIPNDMVIMRVLIGWGVLQLLTWTVAEWDGILVTLCKLVFGKWSIWNLVGPPTVWDLLWFILSPPWKM
jgi:hypothetical protein